MHYYERHIGDYIRSTTSLNMMQEGAYTRLLDQLYQSEAPLPADRTLLYRVARAVTATERKAVDYVLDTFFTLTETGFMQKRASREIARFHEKVARAKRSANWRWDKQREQQGEHANSTCKADANAYANDYAEAMQNACDPVCRIDALHTPISNIHKPVNTPSTASSGDNARNVVPAEGNGGGCSVFDISRTLRDAGVPTHVADPRVRKLADEGVDTATIAAACAEARRSKPDDAIGLPYVLGVLKRWSAEAKALDVSRSAAPASKPNANAGDAWWTSNAGIERKGRDLKLYARGTESHAEFKERLFAEIEKRKVQP